MSKTIMITGASRGLGRVLAQLLIDRGDTVIALGRSSSSLSELNCRIVVADLGRPQELAEAVSDIDHLDVLIHNAGVAEAGPVAELSAQVWQQHLTINLAAPAELTRALLPVLRADGGGQVVFVNSGAGIASSPMFSAYAASKHGLKALADSLRAEEQRNGVRVTTVYPSIIDTDMQQELRDSLGGPYDPASAMSPRTVAATIVSTIDTPPDAVINDLRIAPPIAMPHPAKKAD